MRNLIEIKKKDKLLAIILKKDYYADGVEFITSNELSQQVAYMHHPVGKQILPHVHNLVQRSVIMTQEVLFIKKGKIRVDFYDDYKDYLESTILSEGDVILLVSGGHGFEVIEELEMIEVKQGPYAGEQDKTRFEGIVNSKIMMREE